MLPVLPVSIDTDGSPPASFQIVTFPADAPFLPLNLVERFLAKAKLEDAQLVSASSAGSYASEDEEWKLTAVFAMNWVSGFDSQILEALKSDKDEIHYQAVCAAHRCWPGSYLRTLSCIARRHFLSSA